MSAAQDAGTIADIVARLDRAPCILLLDVDGTLAPVSARTGESVVPVETRRVLAALAARPGVTVAIISGRAAADANQRVSVRGLWVVGNHGVEIMSPNGEIEVAPEVLVFEAAVAQAARALERALAHVRGVIVENKHWTLSIHHRFSDPAIVPYIRAGVESVATRFGLRMTEGKHMLDLRPPVSVDKGTAVLAMTQRLGGPAGAAVLYVGDDRTDEDAFRALRATIPGAATVRVAEEEGASDAEFRVSSPGAVRELLERILERAR